MTTTSLRRIASNATLSIALAGTLAACTTGDATDEADQEVTAPIAWPRAAKNMDSAGNLVTFGWAEGTQVIKTAPDGTVLMTKDLPLGCASDIAVDPSDNILLTCELVSTDTPLDFGGGLLPAAPEPTGNSGFVFAKLAPDGSHIWSHRYFSAIMDTWDYHVTSDVKGNVVIAGSFEDANWDNCESTAAMPFSFGKVTVKVPSITDSLCNANHTMFVAKFTTAGVTSWVKMFSGYSDYPMPSEIAVDQASNIFVAGDINSSWLTGKPTSFNGKYLPAGSWGFDLELSSNGGFKALTAL